uniref:Trehalose 6-phosphate phosphatase n=1 Tax=Anthurium amnicola TaxID=1678845 RepID=A0A1D1YTK5_9ARAE
MTKQNVVVPEAVTMAVPPAAAVPNSLQIFPYRPPRATHPRKNFLKQLEIGVRLNGGRIGPWVESMRASSPTNVKAPPLPVAAPVAPPAVEDDSGTSWLLDHPSALSMFDEILKLSKGKKIVMFLDYDGTLSPIVDDPECAFMSDGMRDAVRNVAKYFPTAIVSGRCRDKVYGFVQLAELYYAGSHGMDIKGPDTHGGHRQSQDSEPVHYQPPSEFLPMIDEVYKTLKEKTKSIPGAMVENNKFCLSVHFRCVDEKRWVDVAEQVTSVLSGYTKLRLTYGRKVLEIRPTFKWDKGKALVFLLETLGFADSSDVLPLYIGDDRTDEDAFKVLRERGQGFGILVSKIPKDTHAAYSLQEPSEVKEFLQRLAEWKRGGARL